MSITVEQLDYLLLAGDENTLKYWKELIYVKPDFYKEGEGTFAVDEALLDHWVATGEEFAKLGIDIPLPVKHSDDPEKNRGKVLTFAKRLDSKNRLGLFGLLEFADAEAAKLARTAKVSIYSPKEYKDEHGTVHKRPIRHVALTDYPVINNLDGFIAASHDLPEGDLSMSLKSLAKELGVEIDDNDDDAKITTKIKAAFTAAKKPKEPEKKPESNPGPTKKNEETPAPKIAASLLDVVRKDRVREIDDLLTCKPGPKITPAVADELKKQYCSDDAVTLSLSADAPNDGFAGVIAALNKNEPVMKLNEQTGAQTFEEGEVRPLELSADKNPLIKNAEQRAEAAKA